MKLRHCILIHHLPLDYMEDAVKSMSELTAISEESISLMNCDHWGGKFILDNENNFRKVLSLCVLNIHGKEYSLYSLVTDLIVRGIGAEIDAEKVEFLLERYAPVLIVYEVKNQDGAIIFRASLNCPEIPEITRLWTELKISGYNSTEFSISPYCRFCRENGHFKSQCRRRKISVAEDGSTSLPNCKVTDKQKTAVTASDNSAGFAIFAKGSSDSNIAFTDLTKESSDNYIEFEKFAKGSSDSNVGFVDLTQERSDSNIEFVEFIKGSSGSNTEFVDFAKESFDRNTRFENFDIGSSDSSAVCRRDSDTNKKDEFEATSSKSLSPSESLNRLIPPPLQNDIEALKLFFSHCKNFKHLYKSALRYPSGVGILLRQLRQIVKFNKDIKSKSEEETKFIAWICLLLSKLQYYHLKKNIQLEPVYVPPL